MNLLVAIPTRSNWVMLAPLLEQLSGLEVVLYDNGHDSPEGQALLAAQENVVDARGWSFYKMWNSGWQYAAEHEYDAVALLNDDIVLHPESLSIAFDALMGDEKIGIVGLNYGRQVQDGIQADAGLRYVSGGYQNYGIGGHAFLMRTSTWGVVPPIDENYVIWYGDDELFANMELYGYQMAIAVGSPVDHVMSTTVNQHPELLAKTGEDAARFKERFR